MVHAHGGDYGSLRHIDDVGGIQCAAKAHFQHGDITVLPAEVQQGNGSYQLKLRRVLRHGLCGRPDLLHQSRQLPVRDHFPIHLNTFMEGYEIGRCIQAHPVSRRLQHGRDTGAGAALAVGTRHMDELLPLLRREAAGVLPVGAVLYPVRREN